MITVEQKLDRLKGLGGSDMPIILGLSKYKTPYQLWLEKTGQLETDDVETEAQYWGNRLESVIRDEFALRNNVDIDTPDTVVHPLFDFMRGNVDGFIKSRNAVLEIKTTAGYNAKEWGDEGTNQIPLYYAVQVAYYCAITNADCAYIAVLIGGNTYREYKYTRDHELELRLIDEAQKFWNCVQNKTEPELTSIDDIKLKYPESKPEKSVSITPDVNQYYTELMRIKKDVKELNAKEEKLKFALQSHMQDAEVLQDDEGKTLASFKTGKRGRTFLLKEAS